MTTTSIIKDQFRNDSGGVAGVVTITARGDVNAVAVLPGDTVWLSEEEQALTANAPKRDTDNPFINGTLTLVTEAAHMKNARPLRPLPGGETEQAVTPVEGIEVGAAPTPTGPPPQGERAQFEEVGTPQVVAEPDPPEVEVAPDGKHVVKAPPRRPKP